ncbi:MAG: TetR/AcrR family transcriptional regulator [Actinobacteria bacterium]|nr:TetR/AcrR family transcriptional regulator [Actinomycetota bacterium]
MSVSTDKRLAAVHSGASARSGRLPLVAQLVEGLDLNHWDPEAPLPRGRHGLSRSVVEASQRGRMLVATADAVSELGYADTAVADIIDRAGVSRKTFYSTFRDKDDAFLTAFAAVDIMVARVILDADEQPDAAGQIRAGIASYLQTMVDEPSFARLFMIEAFAAGDAAIRRRWEVFRSLAEQVSVPLNVAAQVRDDLSPPTADRVLAALVAFNGIVRQRLISGPLDSFDDLIPVGENLIWGACSQVTIPTGVQMPAVA